MAIYANASTDYYERTTTPTITSHTVCCWFYQVTDLGAVYQTIAAIQDPGNNGYCGLFITPDQNLAGFTVGEGAETPTILAVTTGNWYFCAWTNAGSGAGNAKFYAAALSDATLSVQSIAGQPNFSSATVRLFASQVSSEEFDGRIASVKAWDRVLSQAELEIERWSYLPVFTASQHGYWPLWNASDGPKDYSGNGRDWTANGTLTDADGPPLPWSPPHDDENAYVIAAAATGQPYAKRLAGVPFMGGGSGLPWRVRQW